jgi:hypothetical protein
MIEGYESAADQTIAAVEASKDTAVFGLASEKAWA